MNRGSMQNIGKRLVALYGGAPMEGLSLGEYIRWLNEFVHLWDFRKMQANGGERWLVENDEKCEQHKDLILHHAHLLGMTDAEIPGEAPDYILPLGGARLANLARAQGAREMADRFSAERFSVVALTGKRPLNEVELPYTAAYAPDAENEYEAMNKGLECAFELSEDEYLETNYITRNCNIQWSKREYHVCNRNYKVWSLAAPSSVPERRADSFDTFRFFIDQFKVQENQRLLLVTSCIYAPFQLLKFIPISFEKKIETDCYGVSPAVAGSQFSKPSNYLQEMKGVVNAIYHLYTLYGEGIR